MFPFSRSTYIFPPTLCNMLSFLSRRQPISFHIDFSRVAVWMEAEQMPIKRSLPALNLPPLTPRALEMERGLGRVALLCVLVQRDACCCCCCCPRITHEPFVWRPPPTSINPPLASFAQQQAQDRGRAIPIFLLLLISLIICRSLFWCFGA